MNTLLAVLPDVGNIKMETGAYIYSIWIRTFKVPVSHNWGPPIRSYHEIMSLGKQLKHVCVNNVTKTKM